MPQMASWSHLQVGLACSLLVLLGCGTVHIQVQVGLSIDFWLRVLPAYRA